jgi:hypothetical protein
MTDEEIYTDLIVEEIENHSIVRQKMIALTPETKEKFESKFKESGFKNRNKFIEFLLNK